jgi:predicted metalloendopeptidase
VDSIDRAAFDVLGKKLAFQFNKFEPIKGQTTGELTQGENIGDEGRHYRLQSISNVTKWQRCSGD